MECYVCCAEDGELSNGLCACTDRPLHMECQRKLLETVSKDGRCTVCKAVYRNVEVLQERRLRWRRLIFLSVMSVVAVCTTGSSAFIGIRLFDIARQTRHAPLCLLNCTATRTCSNASDAQSMWSENACFDVRQLVVYGSVAVGSLASIVALTSAACIYKFWHVVRRSALFETRTTTRVVAPAVIELGRL